MEYTDDEVHYACEDNNEMAEAWGRGFNDGFNGAMHNSMVNRALNIAYMDGYRAGRKVDLCEQYIELVNG